MTHAGTARITLPQFLARHAPRGAEAALSGDLPTDPFRAWFGIDAEVARRVLAELASRGATFADLYFQHSRVLSVGLEDGIVSRASTSVDQGVGLRVVIGDQTGYAFTEDLTEESMRAAARTAATIAHQGGAPVPAHFSLHEPFTGLYTFEQPWSAIGVDTKLPWLRTIEAMVRAKDPSITKVSASWAESEEHVVIAELDGTVTVDVRPMMRLGVSVTARRGGETVTNSASLAGRHGPGHVTPERLQSLVDEAVKRTLILFESKRPPAGEMPVILAAGASGILLHEAVGHGMEADFNRKGVSVYSTMLDKVVAPEFVTIVDSGLHPNERGALSVDDEGAACERTVLVDRGVLKTYLHDRISARHYGLPRSTGSGRRESFRHVVLPRMRCTYMENGPHDPAEIVKSVKKGIVAETFWNGEVAIGAGDFTFYVKNGWLVEDGRITAPIKDVNIIGNGPEALRNVTMVGNDTKLDTGGWTCGKDGQSVPVSQGMPTVLVSKLTVGGTDA
jgi:TldD protein